MDIAAADGQPTVLIFEIEGLLAPGNPFRQKGDRELGEIQLVPADPGDRLALIAPGMRIRRGHGFWLP